MKNLVWISLLVCSGCAVQPKRVPAGSSTAGLWNPITGTASLYQGPYDINPNFSERKKAKVYLPLQYNDQAQWPMVILLHGFGGTGETEDSYLTLRHRVSSKGFILLTPDGTITPKGTLTPDGHDLTGNQFWNATDFCCDFAKTGVDDVKYLTDLIAAVQAKYHIDSQRIYLFGHSNGGFMANRLACETGKFAGVANLAGGSFLQLKDCKFPKATSYLQIHAVDDETIVYKEAKDYAGGVETVAQWRTRNACGPAILKEPSQDFLFLAPGKDTKIETWKCPAGREVGFWSIRTLKAKDTIHTFRCLI